MKSSYNLFKLQIKIGKPNNVPNYLEIIRKKGF